MGIDFDRLIQNSIGFGFSILNAKKPRFPRLSIWLGNLAMSFGWWATWGALRLGPIHLVLRVLIVRANQARLAAMPLRQRLAVAGIGTIMTGLMDAFQQLCPDIANNKPKSPMTNDDLRAQIKESLKDQLAQ